MKLPVPSPDFEYYTALLRLTGVSSPAVRYLKDWLRRELKIPPGEPLRVFDRELLRRFYNSHPPEPFLGSFPLAYRLMKNEDKLYPEVVELLKLVHAIRNELRDNLEDDGRFDIDLHRSFLFLESFIRRPLPLKRYVQMMRGDVEVLKNGSAKIKIAWQRKGKGRREAEIVLPAMGAFYYYHVHDLLPHLHPQDPNPPLWTNRRVSVASLATIIPSIFLQKGDGQGAWDVDSLKQALVDLALLTLGAKGTRKIGGTKRTLEKALAQVPEMEFTHLYWAHLFEG
jgi:hypothetical protein